MQIKDDLLAYYNDFFNSQEDFVLMKSFEYSEENKVFTGEIKCLNSIKYLTFKVSLAENYPYSDIRFETQSIKGYPHLNYSSGSYWLCLNTPFLDDIEQKLKLEVQRLQEWIKIYVNEGYIDDHYDYLIFPRETDDVMFFNESVSDDLTKRFLDNKFGEFSLYKYKNKGTPILFSDNLGGKTENWNSSVKIEKNKDTAYWVYIENEPIDKDGNVYTSWSDLMEYTFSQDFKDYISSKIRYEYAKNKRGFFLGKNLRKKGGNNVKIRKFNIPVAIGYKIPSKKGYEVHWELSFLFYAAGKKLEKIAWAKSKNISRERFFGRGGFCNTFQDLSILILGVGAIGSSIAEILSRGGVSEITLVDGDTVDTGNICRSNYNIHDFDNSKVKQLGSRLEAISPYVNVKISELFFSSYPYYSDKYQEQVNFLKKFDLIIDCTASNEVLHFISSLDITNPFITIGITNKSLELICLCKLRENYLFDLRRVVLHSFGQVQYPTFYEGTGCFYPTFEAAYFDINALVNSALRHLNNSYSAKESFNSFHLAFDDGRIELNDYHLFTQQELNFTLTVSQNAIDSMYLYASRHYPHEFGGALIGGYSEDGKNVFLTDILIPDNFESRSTFFRADTKKINTEIEEIYTKTDGNIIYLGDWHSHPNMSHSYSHVDFKSIERQAKSPLVSINNPIMAIVSISPEDYDIGFYIYYKNKLYTFTAN